MPHILRRVANLLSFPNLLLLILWCSPLLFGLGGPRGRQFLEDPDIWWHLRNAQMLFQSHQFITTDPYSYTVRGLPWINPEWLAEIPFYFGYHLWGIRGVFYVGLFAFDLIVAGVFYLALRRSRDFTAAYIAALGFVLLAAINFGPRTILFGWICFVLELLILDRARSRGRQLWWLVPLFCVWINLHGSWIIGLAFFAVYAASGLVQGRWGDLLAEGWTSAEKVRLAAVGAVSVAALFLNPYGWRLVLYPFDFAFKQRLNVSRGQDWMSVDFHTLNGKLFLLVLVGLAVLTLLRRRTWRLDEVLFALLAIYSAATYVRFLFLAGIVLAPALAAEIAGEQMEREPERNRPLLNAALMLAVLGIAVARSPRDANLRLGIEDAYPAAAFERLATFDPQDHVFNFYGYGGYMIWNDRRIPTFIDSRTDIFEHHGILADYTRAVDLRATLAVLDEYKVRYVCFPKNDPVVYLLEHVPGWKVNLEVGEAVILERAGK